MEWAAISFSMKSSQPRDWTQVFHIVGKSFTVWATREVKVVIKKTSSPEGVAEIEWASCWHGTFPSAECFPL